MNPIDTLLAELKAENRLVTLRNGQPGLRSFVPCEVKAVDGSPSEAPEMDFVASTAAVDRYDEVIQQDGWDLQWYVKNPVVIDSHDYTSIDRLLGISSSVAVKEGALVNRVRFATVNPRGKLAYELAKGGFLRAQSVGFIPREYTRGQSKDEPRRIYTKSELIEISLVPVPANQEAVRGIADIVDRETIAGVLEEFRSQDGNRSNASETGPDATFSRLLQTVADTLGLKA